MKAYYGLIAVAFLGLPVLGDVVAHAGEQAIVVSDNNQKRTIRCGGSPVEVRGNQNTITLLGICSRVGVYGNTNTVKVQTTGSIYVSGNENKVRWQDGMGVKPPTISSSGNNNSITRGR